MYLTLIKFNKFLLLLLLKLFLKLKIVFFLQIVFEFILIDFFLGPLYAILYRHFHVQRELAFLDAQVFEEVLDFFLFRKEVLQLSATVGFHDVLSFIQVRRAIFMALASFETGNRQVELCKSRFFRLFWVSLHTLQLKRSEVFSLEIDLQPLDSLFIQVLRISLLQKIGHFGCTNFVSLLLSQLNQIKLSKNDKSDIF